MFKMVRIGLATFGALILSAAGTGVSLMAFSSVASASTAMSVVPVTVLDGQGTSEGARPTVEVSVGNSPPVPVLLDTGSSGLHIFDNAVDTGADSGVTLTDQPANITYSGGHRFTGVVANAVVKIGSASTKLPVSFAYVEQASCIASKPTCPASGGIPGFEQSGAYGILGIGTQSSGGGVISPILGMPRALGKRWSLHLDGSSGSLVLGAKLPTRRSSTTIQMTQIGTSAGKDLWGDSQLPLCISVGTESECVPALFDSGTYTMQISGPSLDQAPTIPGTAHVVVGTPVSVSVSGSAKAFWTFSAGTTKSENLLTVESDEGPFLNTGVQAFYDFTITYDDINGQIRLSSPRCVGGG
jgi:hypothetical protein